MRYGKTEQARMLLNGYDLDDEGEISVPKKRYIPPMFSDSQRAQYQTLCSGRVSRPPQNRHCGCRLRLFD